MTIVGAYKHFIRSRSVLAGLGLLFITGLISLLIGRQFMQRQEQHVRDVTAWQQEHIDRHVASPDQETGLLLYYLRFTIANKANPFNALSIGQKDVHPAVKSLTIRNLEAQQYDSDLYNPSNLLLGNLDYSFVLIYLFPLVLIAFTYNTLSSEKENGTWSLLVIQSGRPWRLLAKLFSLRCATIFAVFGLLLLAAAVLLQLPFDASLLAVAALGAGYLLFWSALSFWVVSWQQSSAVNAVSLLAFWVLLTLVAPASLNSYLTNKYPVPEALETALDQRRGYHEKWDMDKQATMDKFFNHYPQFSKYPLPADQSQFSWLWYYAMQQMGDDDAQQKSTEMKAKLQARERAAGAIASFVPTLHAQWQMDHIAQSGLSNYLQFQDSAARFHEKMRLYFYPKIFDDTPVETINWDHFPVEFFAAPQVLSIGSMLLPVFLFSLLLLGLSAFRFKKTI